MHEGKDKKTKKTSNNKGKPLGSGTISNARRERRQQMFANNQALAAEQPWSWSSDWWHGDAAPGGTSQSSTWRPAAHEDHADPDQWHHSDWKYSSWSFDKEAEKDVHEDSQQSRKQTPAEWLNAPVTPPWRKVETSNVDQLGTSVKTELSSSSNSDDWGKSWKGDSMAKRVKVSSDESIIIGQQLFDLSSFAGAEAKAEEIKQLLYPKVGIDWHNCLEVQGYVDEQSLEKLLDVGVECNLLSYCFKNTAVKFIERANQMRCALELKRIETTEKRTGPGGKVDLYDSWCVDVCFDDAEDICKEAYNKGMQVFPICTKYVHHQWFIDEGHKPYPSFAHAVDHFLELYS